MCITLPLLRRVIAPSDESTTTSPRAQYPVPTPGFQQSCFRMSTVIADACPACYENPQELPRRAAGLKTIPGLRQPQRHDDIAVLRFRGCIRPRRQDDIPHLVVGQPTRHVGVPLLDLLGVVL
jgi:hypothetical protein